jgi:SAM-dependent methyltransferase
MNGLIAAEHEARYRWAAAVVAGRDVLDAGCGVGYGTKICADAGAARVVGVDVSDTALADAARRIRDVPRAEVRHADVCALPLATATFDVVLCFEAIEHIADPERALDELRRVLRPEGVLLISSPHRGVYPAGNPYHVHEYTPVELEAALRSRFANVRMHYQNVWLGSLISGADALAVASADRELEGSVRKVTPAAPGEEIYTLAVASDAPLPALGNIVVLTGGADLAALHARIDGLEQETHRAWKEAERWRRLATARHPHDARRTGAGTHRPVYDNR